MTFGALLVLRTCLCSSLRLAQTPPYRMCSSLNHSKLVLYLSFKIFYKIARKYKNFIQTPPLRTWMNHPPPPRVWRITSPVVGIHRIEMSWHRVSARKTLANRIQHSTFVFLLELYFICWTISIIFVNPHCHISTGCKMDLCTVGILYFSTLLTRILQHYSSISDITSVICWRVHY